MLLFLLLLSVLVHSAFGQQLPQFQQPKNPMKNANAVDEEMLSNAKVASHQLLFDRLSAAKNRFVHNQLAKMMAMEEEEEGNGGGGGGIERRIPRPQRRWLMRTQELKDGGSGGDQYVKRVVSESELNSLLKNAWLGKKK
ncbi:hypothetical protein GPALN_005554 [Globodera pallida]|nr:hypothetical protein GPALN_005554 [Globodera pallida]